ncbi:MAG: pyridoxal-phosphate dependent enzyme [Bacteroidota bacterium]
MIKTPTPLQSLQHPILEEKMLKIWVKRDDLTDSEIMGNKWRKLKYNIEEAKYLGKESMVTMGGAFSNHIAATAAAGSRFGFKTIGIIRGEELNSDSNHTLRAAEKHGMKLNFVDRAVYRDFRADPSSIVESYPKAYFLPEGGTNDLAIKGCEEILDEIDILYDLVICPVGTGGTFCGLAAALRKNASLLGISALKGNFIKSEVRVLLKRQGISNPNLTINTQYHFGGYAKRNAELLEFMDWFEETFSISLDPVYTAKSFFAVWDMVKSDKFEKNLRIILLHSGGLQGR